MRDKGAVASGNGVTIRYGGKSIFLDPRRAPQSGLAFVSHAHIDHVHVPSQSATILASRETAVLARARGFELGQVHESLDGFELVDTGHVLGSRGLLIDGEAYYTGDIAGRPRAFLGKGKAVKCKTLIIEATYGKSGYKFPPVAQVVERVNRLIAESYSRGIPVVLMGYPLGKAQVLSYIFSAWEPIYVHEAVGEMNDAHRRLGVGIGEGWKTYFEAEDRELLRRRPWVLISPLRSGRSRFISALKKRYGAVTVAFTGWSCDSRYKYAMALDYAMPLSDHCDFQDLMNLVKESSPDKVYTVYGFASEFAGALRGMGYDATPLLGVQTSLGEYSRGE